MALLNTQHYKVRIKCKCCNTLSQEYLSESERNSVTGVRTCLLHLYSFVCMLCMSVPHSS